MDLPGSADGESHSVVGSCRVAAHSFELTAYTSACLAANSNSMAASALAGITGTVLTVVLHRDHTEASTRLEDQFEWGLSVETVKVTENGIVTKAARWLAGAISTVDTTVNKEVGHTSCILEPAEDTLGSLLRERIRTRISFVAGFSHPGSPASNYSGLEAWRGETALGSTGHSSGSWCACWTNWLTARSAGLIWNSNRIPQRRSRYCQMPSLAARLFQHSRTICSLWSRTRIGPWSAFAGSCFWNCGECASCSGLNGRTRS